MCRLLVFLLFSCYFSSGLVKASEAQWIGLKTASADSVNVWAGFRKDFKLSTKPTALVLTIAVDSKYWLYINDQLVIFEGGLKRGPNPRDTYADEVDIAKYLTVGENTISLKVWYFGKQGFSHNSSGKLGLYISSSHTALNSNASWMVKRLREYQTSDDPKPNFRLAESNILYDASLADEAWFLKKKSTKKNGFQPVEVYGPKGIAPWHNLYVRPIPQWKDFGLKNIDLATIRQHGDTIKVKLPYNMQFTPYLKVEAKAGQLIRMLTDNNTTYNGSTDNVRAAYKCRDGVQEYESLGWLNGHELYYIIPSGVKVLGLSYRETGYDTEFTGTFNSSNTFLNKLREKAARTLYITMRDNYMDCPDRERAQWTGDAVLEAEEAFYALSPSSHQLTRKWLKELIDWQRIDGSLFSPIPAGNWSKELPDQILASIGYYGTWMYYLHTGDRTLLVETYPQIQRYLALWEITDDGLVKFRDGDWTWGDWGENKDMLLLYNLWYYLAVKGNYEVAKALNKPQDAAKYLSFMQQFKKTFNARYWNGISYRDPAYSGRTDDRVHALAVLAGIAEESFYPAIKRVFSLERNASPYMEKYVYEAMYQMQLPEEANRRHEERFATMVNNDYFTTLFEGWGIGKDGFGGGTVNHAWSGGGLTIMSAYICGIKPLSPGYKTIAIKPQIGNLTFADARVHSVNGYIKVSMQQDSTEIRMQLDLPADTELTLPAKSYKAVTINNEPVASKGNLLSLAKGRWTITLKK